ncbi:MAG: N-acetylmuramoyl-L-alanine amidase [Acidobacteriota bacterium]
MRALAALRQAGAALALALALLLTPGAVLAGLSQGAFDQDVARFDALRKDPGSTGRRDLWKALEGDFAALAKAGGNTSLAAKALYYQAWSTAELARRSALDADYEAAASLYQRLARNFPTHAWADDALLRRAVILAEKLKRPAEAKADLETILKKYRKGDMAAQAKKFLAAFADTPPDTPAAADTGKAASPEPAKAAAPEPAKTAAPEPAKAKAPASAKAAAARASGPAPATSARPAVLSKTALEQTAAGSRLTLTLTRETAYRYQILDQKRANGEAVKLLYIDLDNTRTNAKTATEHRFAKGPVSRLRAGYFTPETVRVVLELESLGHYEIHAEADPFRVVLSIDADKAAPKTQTAEASPPKKDAPAREVKAPAMPPPLPATPGSNLRPSESAKKNAANLVEQLGLSVRTVMIDPGHGGKDPGAQGLGGLTEKDVNLRFGRILGEALQKKGFNVVYTRATDTFIPLETRTEMANSKGADLFVSIHCNAHGDAGSSGLETYSLNLANSRDAVRVAARENAASQKKISDLQAILTDLMLSAKTAESKDLAGFVQKRAIGGIRGSYSTRDRGPHEAPFFVLIGANMPAVLVELGYITNPEDAKRLASDAYMQALARGMVDGILAYKKRLERYAKL